MAIDADNILRARREQYISAGHARRADPAQDDFAILQLLVHNLQRIKQTGQQDDSGSMLIVMEDRNIEILLQPLFDLEAARRRDILQINAAEGRGNRLNRPYDLIRILRVQTDWERVDVRQLLEQHRLAFHDRHRRHRADIAQTEHSGSIGDNRHGIPFDCQRERAGRIFMDGHAYPRHPGV